MPRPTYITYNDCSSHLSLLLFFPACDFRDTKFKKPTEGLENLLNRCLCRITKAMLDLYLCIAGIQAVCGRVGAKRRQRIRPSETFSSIHHRLPHTFNSSTVIRFSHRCFRSFCRICFLLFLLMPAKYM